MERDSEDDDEEMLDGVAQWDYENDEGSGSGGSGGAEEEGSGGEEGEGSEARSE
jgi:sister-chromatid-cohesion protein PDS5